MNSDFDLIDINVHDPLRKRGVLYVGQYGTSGYAIAARGYICDFLIRGVPVSWTPLRFDDSELSEDNHYNILAKSVINRKIEDIGTIILHCTADLWPKYRSENANKFTHRNLIGYTVWETSNLPENWASYINESVNEVWCPSQYNLQVFKNSGVTIPIRVVPHVFLRNELPRRDYIAVRPCAGDAITANPNVYTFYNISELNERKNVIGLVEAYCQAFNKTDAVRLILKVHYKNYSAENLSYCISKITSVLRQYPNHAPVLMVARNLSEVEMMALHSIGDCYVSLTRSEAFGLTIFDAFNYGRKVIVPGCGGQVDYLGANYEGLVNYQLEDVKNMEGFTHGYYMQGVQQWANPDIDHAIAIMRKVFNEKP
jgi:glycosyltransferase involved in cell wall biosynthesis